MLLITAAGCGTSESDPPPIHRPPASTSSPYTDPPSTTDACGPTYTPVPGEVVHVDGEPSCLDPTPLADFCASQREWVAEFGPACPTRDALVGALESGEIHPVAGYPYGCAVEWTCSDGRTRIGLDTGYWDAGYAEAWFDESGTMTAYVTWYSFWVGGCCAGEPVWRTWNGEPQPIDGCGEPTRLECPSGECWCTYYGTYGSYGPYDSGG